jgi:hypothetical protein
MRLSYAKFLSQYGKYFTFQGSLVSNRKALEFLVHVNWDVFEIEIWHVKPRQGRSKLGELCLDSP